MLIRLLRALPLFALLALAGCGPSSTTGQAPTPTLATTSSTATLPTPPPTPPGPSGSPAPSGPVLFAGQQDGTLQALRPSDGTLYWHYTMGGGAPPTLNVENGVIYAAGADGELHALDAHTSQLLWSFGVGATFTDAVANGVVFVASADGTLLAIKATDASILWRQSLNNSVALAPVVGNGAVYVGDNAGVSAYSVSDGSLLWQNNIAGGVASDLLLSDGAVSALGMDGTFYSFDASDGALRWKVAYGVIATAGPIVTAGDGLIYLDSPAGTSPQGTDGSLQALNANTGAMAWRVGGTAFGSLTDSGGILYISAGNKLLALHDSTGAADWSFTMAGTSTALVANGLLYVGSGDAEVYCLAASDGSVRWHISVGGEVNTLALSA